MSTSQCTLTEDGGPNVKLLVYLDSSNVLRAGGKTGTVISGRTGPVSVIGAGRGISNLLSMRKIMIPDNRTPLLTLFLHVSPGYHYQTLNLHRSVMVWAVERVEEEG